MAISECCPIKSLLHGGQPLSQLLEVSIMELMSQSQGLGPVTFSIASLAPVLWARLILIGVHRSCREIEYHVNQEQGDRARNPCVHFRSSRLCSISLLRATAAIFFSFY